MTSLRINEHHSKIESNHIDPDDGNSWLCTACNLPIFATPFTGAGATLLHDYCADLPEKWKNYELHPQKPLLLGDNKSSATCSKCSEKCGSKLYFCPDSDSDCGLVLDVACALPIMILHRSHRHRLMAVRGSVDSSSFHKCGICGVAHQEAAAAAKSVSYFCNVCGFWIHPDCATSASVIVHEKHVHPLVLFYDVRAAVGVHAAIQAFGIFSALISPESESIEEISCRKCAICGNDVAATRFGVYSCIDCRNCIIHIGCAASDRWNFKPVLGREAQFATVIRLPFLDEHQSIVKYVKGALQNLSWVHDHQLTLQHHSITKSNEVEDEDEDEDESDVRVCDVCLKIIKSPDPFYTCSVCPTLFLHDFCYHMPPLLTRNPAHIPHHQLILSLGFPYRIENNFCHNCKCQFIKNKYWCLHCDSRYNLDVSCALMPDVVTHDEHATAHFLRLSQSSSRACCDCCGRSLGKLAYECRTCPNFALHTWCAMLPKNVTHKFDPHPLHLITPANANANSKGICVYDDICEICENGIDNRVWYYSCERCNQSFHVDCIPCLDLMYKIKSLVRVGEIRGRAIPTRLIRGLTLQGHGHDYCADVADEYDDILP